MRVDVTFEQADMEVRPAFDITIPMDGEGNGVVFIPDVSEDGILSWTNNGNLPNPEPVNIKGIAGADGYSPTAKVTQTANGAVITITDKNGTTHATIRNGAKPVKGTDYWTEADRTQMVADVIAALPVYNGEVV